MNEASVSATQAFVLKQHDNIVKNSTQKWNCMTCLFKKIREVALLKHFITSTSQTQHGLKKTLKSYFKNTVEST